MSLPTPRFTTSDHKSRRFTVLYSGETKSGKTHNALSWPRPGVLYFETNLATLEKFAGIPYLLGKDIGTIEKLEMSVLPMLEQGKADELFGQGVQAQLLGGPAIQTIVLDSATEMFSRLINEIQGSRERLSMPDFGKLLSRGESIIKRFVELSQPSGTRPQYHFVATVHLRDVTDDEGGLTKIRPAIPGQMKDVIGRFFDTVFVCKQEVTKDSVTMPDKSVKLVPVTKRVVWTIPQDKFHVCGDGVGGGELRVLPPVCGGTWPELSKAWGLED